MRFTTFISFVAALVVLSMAAGPAQASVITTGDVDPGGAGTQPDPWAVGGTLTVGDSSSGTLNIESEGVVTSTTGRIGEASGSTGIATVTGSGSQWNNSYDLGVGTYGSGSLSVEAGGEVTNTYGWLGAWSDSTGVATVTGSGSQWTNSGVMSVGKIGDGTLNVDAGGVVANTIGYIGEDYGSTGIATITGSGSQWNNSGSLYIGGGSLGSGGSGTLNLTDSGLAPAH